MHLVAMARTEEPAASPGTIRCPSCGHANRPDRRFCAKCGVRLGDVCAACGTQNDPDENFCSHCGAALSAATASSAAAKPVVRQEPPEAEKLPAGERRQLTVVFCDLVGSTALSQQLDPEEWRAVVVQYLKAAAEAVARHGGHVAKTLGDGLLVYFGWPRAHEDDAERAVRAGLGIVDAVGALNRRLQHRLAVRIVGEPGVGKSRRALALHEDLAGVPHTWFESGGQPYFADTPFYAMTELLKRLFAWTGEDTAEARVAALERALGAVRETGAKAFEPLVHVERAELASQSGDAEGRERELREAHRLFTAMGAAGHAARLARELSS